MASILLVHGAWQGAWCSDRLVPLLRRDAHDPLAIDLTGCGARAPIAADVDLTTHINDVVDAAARIEESRFVLVAHSYAGMVAAGVAEVLRSRLCAVVLIDAFYPQHGEAAIDQMPPAFRARFRTQAGELGDGWRLPASDDLLDVWGLREDDDRRWVRSRMTDWSLRCFEASVDAAGAALAAVPRWYVAGVGDHPAGVAFAAIAQRAEADGCTRVDLACGHDVQVERPVELAAVISDAAQRCP